MMKVGVRSPQGGLFASRYVKMIPYQGDLMAKVAAQLQSQGEFSSGSRARQQSQMTELEGESWNGRMPRIAWIGDLEQMWQGLGYGWGGTGCSFKAPLKLLGSGITEGARTRRMHDG